MSEPTAETIVITGLGALSPVGANAEQTCAAIRAGMAAFKQHAYYECIPDTTQQNDEPTCYTASVPVIDPYLDGPERLLQLALPALHELIDNVQFNLQDACASGLFLALPQGDEVVNSWQLDTWFIPQLCQRLSLADFKTTKINQEGRSGVFSLVADAIEALQTGQLDYCIVGGVDSWLIAKRMALLDADWRFKSERNVDGFIPGEAAVMLMLETAAHAQARGAPALTRIGAVGFGMEPETLYSDQVSTGQGLADALNGALQSPTTQHFLESVYCDLNGESYSAFEWGLMLARLGPTLEHIKKLIHPAENCGDVGAASGGLLLACASKAFQHGHPIGHEALLWTASDTGKRSAISLAAPSNNPQGVNI